MSAVRRFRRWFTGGVLNTCYNAVDRATSNVGAGKQRALIYDSPVTGTVRSFTYVELRDEVARLAGAIAPLGVQKGDRVIIYMPAVPEAVFAMLACARIGAVHSVVFGGFAPRELATRIDDAKPKLMLSASCGIEGGAHHSTSRCSIRPSICAKHKPDRCLILQRPQDASHAEERARSRLARSGSGVAARRLCGSGRHRSALHPLHVRDDRHVRRASSATTAVTRSR